MPRVPASRVASLPLLSLLVSCGGGGGADSQPPATVDQAIRQASEMGANAAARGADPIAAKQLQERLPEQLRGFARGETERSDVGAMGFKMSIATATYTDDDRRMEVSLTDTGNIGAAAPMAASWAMMDFDRTTNTGYERTIRFEGHKGYEELSNSGGRLRTELSLILESRVILQIKGYGVEMDELKKAASDLGLRSLARAN